MFGNDEKRLEQVIEFYKEVFDRSEFKGTHSPHHFAWEKALIAASKGRLREAFYITMMMTMRLLLAKEDQAGTLQVNRHHR